MRSCLCNCLCARPGLAVAVTALLTLGHLGLTAYGAVFEIRAMPPSERRVGVYEGVMHGHAICHGLVFFAIAVAAHRGSAYVARWLCVVFAASTGLLFVHYSSVAVPDRLDNVLGGVRLALLFAANIAMRGFEANVWRMRPGGGGGAPADYQQFVSEVHHCDNEFAAADVPFVSTPPPPSLRVTAYNDADETVDDAPTEDGGDGAVHGSVPLMPMMPSAPARTSRTSRSGRRSKRGTHRKKQT